MDNSEEEMKAWTQAAAHEILGMMPDLKFRSDSLVRIAEVIAKHASPKEEMVDEEVAMYIFVGWNNGSYVTSRSEDFKEELKGLTEQYGTPDKIEFRKAED